MDIEKYVDKECKKIAKMANKQLLRPNRKIYIAWAFRQRMFKYLTKEALERFEPYWPDDYYRDDITIENGNSKRTYNYTYGKELLNEYSRFDRYKSYADITFEQHLKNVLMHKVKNGIEYNLKQILITQRPYHYFKEYYITNLLINCYALTLLHDGTFNMPYNKLLKYFMDRPHWFITDKCSTFMAKNSGFDLKIQLIEKRLLFKTDLNAYLIWLEFNFDTNSSELKIEITDNTTAPEIDGIAMTDEGLLVYDMLHYGEDKRHIKEWTVNETTSSKPNEFAFYGYDENGN